ncbi:hypothetical protein DFR48_101761 [Ciceribacter lividus]|uniref:Uncharacterized protein n=1 Tax=Ciceribacter lividus TaxID=1197950 RepID=A0A6I7HUA9_9HYPH|nr:hypothetical protein DFR48_101761 [Ciceribacter lividus]
MLLSNVIHALGAGVLPPESAGRTAMARMSASPADARRARRLADQRHGKGHEECRAYALNGPRRDQQLETRCETADQRGEGEEAETGDEHPLQTMNVAEAAGDDDRRRQAREIGDDDRLNRAEGGGERPGQRRQRDVGDAGAERGEQHCECKRRRDHPRPFRSACFFLFHRLSPCVICHSGAGYDFKST